MRPPSGGREADELRATVARVAARLRVPALTQQRDPVAHGLCRHPEGVAQVRWRRRAPLEDGAVHRVLRRRERRIGQPVGEQLVHRLPEDVHVVEDRALARHAPIVGPAVPCSAPHEPRDPGGCVEEPRRAAHLQRRRPADQRRAAHRDRRPQRGGQDDPARAHHRRPGGGRRDDQPRPRRRHRLPAPGDRGDAGDVRPGRGPRRRRRGERHRAPHAPYRARARPTRPTRRSSPS